MQRWRRSAASGRRDRRDRLKCPQVVVEYHKWMRGVDVFSQRTSYSQPGRKSRRWWPRLAWFLIDMCISNARVLYTRHQRATSAKDFRLALMLALVGGFTARKKRGRPPSVKVAADVPHIPELHRPKAQPCTVCAKTISVGRGGNKPRTREGCKTCGIAVHHGCWEAHLPHAEPDEREEEDSAQ